jgi:hypothetical protein
MRTEQKLVCIRQGADYYRTTRQVALNLVAGQLDDDDTKWRYTTKGAWRRLNGKYIEAPVF